jgi:hypothetical protein
MSARVQCTPVLFSSPTAPGVFPINSGSQTGVDAAGSGTAFATAWGGTISGVYFANPNGLVWVYYTCGTTAASTYQVLVGDQVGPGATGLYLPATANTGTIAASTSGWLGPFSPATYNQTTASIANSYSGAINSTALISGMQGCVVIDFTATTALEVRVYTTNAIFP